MTEYLGQVRSASNAQRVAAEEEEEDKGAADGTSDEDEELDDPWGSDGDEFDPNADHGHLFVSK